MRFTSTISACRRQRITSSSPTPRLRRGYSYRLTRPLCRRPLPRYPALIEEDGERMRRGCRTARISVGNAPAPEVLSVQASVEASSFYHCGSVRKSPGDDRWFMGVASENDGIAARLIPPAHDHGRERHLGVHLKGAAGTRQHTKHGTVLILIRRSIEAASPRWPV